MLSPKNKTLRLTALLLVIAISGLVIYLLLANVLNKAESPRGEYSALILERVVLKDGMIDISGLTDLPDSALINVNVDVWRPTSAAIDDTPLGIDAEAIVEDGKFKTAFSFLQRPAFVSGPYKVSLLFSPRAQRNPTVLEKVGSNGEHLNGPLVRDYELGFKTLTLTVKTTLTR